VSRDRPSEPGSTGLAPVDSVETLVDFLRSGCKPTERFRVGTEHEKIGLRAGDHDVVSFDGPRGIEALLERVAELDGWQRASEGGRTVALEKNGASITLEPGGQLELSGAPLRTIHETCDEFHAHLSLMKEASDPLGLVWLGLGINPLYGVDRIPVMPKERYRIMRSYLPTRGSLALEMMFATATVQANFDYRDEADMVDKVRTATAVTSIVSAIFANSGLSERKANGFVSKRLHIWQHTDPDRCGLMPMVFEPDFGFRRYVEWAIDVPMFFVLRDGRYHATPGLTFRRFMQQGLGEVRATVEDFDRHLTTLFPEVRLKRIIEVRGADAVPPGLTCSLPALWKGLLYDDEARAAAWALVADAPFAVLEAARADVALRGLAATHGGVPVAELARALAEIARDGLRRIGHAGRRDADETCFLDPIFEQLELGRSPGSVVVDRWEGEWGRSVDRLIDYARY